MRLILLLLFASSFFSYSQEKRMKEIDLNGLVICVNTCLNILTEEDEDDLTSFLNDTNITTFYFRLSNGNNYHNMFSRIKKIFPEKKFIIERISTYKVRNQEINPRKERKISTIEILTRSVNTNKIFIFIFDNDEYGFWRLGGFAHCINYGEYNNWTGKPCIDE